MMMGGRFGGACAAGIDITFSSESCHGIAIDSFLK